MNWKMIAKLLGYSEDVNYIYSSALQLARSEQDDTGACAALQKRIGKKPSRSARAALVLLRKGEADYETDRAVRLLEAATNDHHVSVMNPAREALFMREKELGLQPLRTAIVTLSDLDPRLDHLLREVSDRTVDEGHDGGTVAHLNQLVGPNSDLQDELLKSQLALSLVSHYIAAVKSANESDLDIPYFAAPLQLVVRAGQLG